ncbi:nucleoside recognition domain-containing protein [Anaeromyxobacter paludicola]|uniref:Nucleoside recognition protein n=1 Tax=Anaeromyxobacter paludicola TaxID=2918171 RepID=A0ABN6N885_9BACT|nr:nucleoside recognition domain-containing protein [Anaeromyxobacter paludicola]BDG09413.1 nucleoside recognition protein [Anaeromyxobacter paludicola]
MGAILAVLFAVSVAAAAVNGRMEALTGAVVQSAQQAVALALGLAGVMALWLGLMKVAEEAGLVGLLARAARPLLRRLFPEVPPDHPAMGAMLMNLSANLLGLGNAATPFGLEAMRRLEELKPAPGPASDAQALFCAMNTASLQLVPATVIALRAAAGSRAPAEIIGATLLATSCSIVVAVAAAKGLRRLYPGPPAQGGPADRPPPSPPGGAGGGASPC